MANSDNGITKQADLPDLPALETVEARDTRIIVAMLYIILMSFFPFGFIIIALFMPRSASFLSRLLPSFVVMVPLWLLLLWLLRRSCLYCKTDTEGITVGLLSHRLIPWNTIEDARTYRGIFRRTFLILKLNSRPMAISLDQLGASGEIILASIWQHLRRAGVTDRILLSPVALSLWEAIPDDVPQEMDWRMTFATGAKYGSLAGILIFALFGIAAFWGFIETAGIAAAYCLLMAIFFVLIGGFFLWPELFHRAYSVKVRESGLEAELAFETVIIPWDEISSAKWQSKYLIIKANPVGKEVWIFYNGYSKVHEQLILAIIRHLRAAKIPQAVPLLGSKARKFFNRN